MEHLRPYGWLGRLGTAERRYGSGRLRWSRPTSVSLSVIAGVVFGYALTTSRSLAIVAVCLIVLLAAIAHLGLLGVAVLFTAGLPWLVAFGDVLPRLTETFAAGATMALVTLVAVPRKDGSHASF